MNMLRPLIIMIMLLVGYCSALAQNIYTYPNQKLSDQGLLEYRRYTLNEAEAYEQGGSFDTYFTLDWGPERRLTEQENVYRARVVTNGDSLFVGYQRIWGRQAYFIRSLDSGSNWEGYQTLVDSSHNYSYSFPEIVRNGTNLLLEYGIQEAPYGNNLGYFRSTNYGETWGHLRTAFPRESNEIGYTSLCNVGQVLYGSFDDAYTRDSIYVIRSSDWGGTWNGRGANVAYLNGTPQPMTVRASGNTVHLVWVNEESPISCRYSRSTDGGQTWSEEMDIANDDDGAQRVFVAIQDTHVVVSWMGYKYSPYSFTGDLFIKQSFDSGATWGQEQVLTGLHKVWSGTVYIEGGLIVAVWEDDRFRDVNNNSEAFAIFSEDYGGSWSEETRLSYGDNHSYDPISCSTGQMVHVIWGDIRPESPGLYYSANDMTTGVYDHENTLPPKTSFIFCYPNPFNSSTVIGYCGLEGGEIGIYNITGQIVRKFNMKGKEGRISWDATDVTGHRVSSGVYFIKGLTSLGHASTKVLFLR